VPRIPTPFIGGSDSPRREQAKEDLAPPFHPEADAAEAVSADVEAETEEPVAVEAFSIEVDELAVEAEESLEDVELVANDLEEVAAEEFAVGIVEEEEEEEEEREEEQAITTDGGDDFFPDFLSADQEAAAAEEPTEEAPTSSRERLAEMAEELRAGEFGGLIRTLVDELGPYAAEIAIARAFAAGYQAGKDREE